MAEVKWIKVMVTLFENRKIKQIETLPQGSALILLWLRLLCLPGSINDEGMVYLTRDIPYTHQMLATQLQQPLSLVTKALEVFVQFGMIDINDGIIRILNWQKYQNTQSLEKIREQTRQRVARHRERKGAVTPHCNVTVAHTM